MPNTLSGRLKNLFQIENSKMQKKILVVDDDKAIRELFNYHLLKKGCIVKSVSEGSNAINAIKKEKYDLVFLDITMPGISGMEVLKTAAKVSPETKIVMVTGLCIDGLLICELKEYGAYKFISKPFDMSDAMKIVDEPG